MMGGNQKQGEQYKNLDIVPGHEKEGALFLPWSISASSTREDGMETSTAYASDLKQEESSPWLLEI